MFDSTEPVAAGMAAAVGAALACDLTALSDEAVLSLTAELEVQRRRLAAVDHRVLAELEQRGVGLARGYPSTQALLVDVLRIGFPEATARVRAAGDLAPRRTVTGQLVPAVFPLAAGAIADGAIGDRHAAVITATIHALPEAVADEHADTVEQVLTEHARTLNPVRLAQVARVVAAYLDPDGALATAADVDRRRCATLTGRRDGSGVLHADLTGEALAVWQAVLDALTAPTPVGDDGEPDRRSPGQRRHDGLLDAGHRLLRSDLPDTGGTPATVLITMTADQLRGGDGLAATSRGGTLPVDGALRLADQADIVPVVLSDRGGVLSYGRTRRTASAGQRRALAARDGGCSFPGCDRPPAWTQAHHVTTWADGGATDLQNLTLVCGFHHREHTRRGWRCHIRDGVPQWTPPHWIDPEQRPRRNTTHRIAVSRPPPQTE